MPLPPKDECKEVHAAEEIVPLDKEDSENKNPASSAEASKKNKKKKKKAAPATSEEVDKKEEEVKKEVLGEIDNRGENAAEVKPFELLYPRQIECVVVNSEPARESEEVKERERERERSRKSAKSLQRERDMESQRDSERLVLNSPFHGDF